MIRVAALAILIALLLALGRLAAEAVRRELARRRATTPRIPGGHGSGPHRGRPRRLRAVPTPEDDRAGMLAFLESRRGVEAYVEPQTVVSALSVVLVAQDGEWQRSRLEDDAILRELSGRGLPIYDASKVGYPDRMRRYQRTHRPEPNGGTDLDREDGPDDP